MTELKLMPRRKSFLAKIAIFSSICVFLTLGFSQAGAQSPQADAAKPSFEVASIKPNHGDDGLIRFMFRPDGLTASGMTVKVLIEFAYNMKDFQVSGGPGWIESERFDVDAKMDEATMDALKKLPLDQAVEQRRLMLQSLLADRFQLKVSRSSKELPIYALVVAKGGPKLTQAADTPAAGGSSGAPGPGKGRMRMSPGELNADAIPMSNVADWLAREVGRKVVDKTGLEGRYVFNLHWTPEGPAGKTGFGDSGPGPAPPPPDSSGVSIFTALQEQLGLKLEPQKGPVETLIIDSIEKPSEN